MRCDSDVDSWPARRLPATRPFHFLGGGRRDAPAHQLCFLVDLSDDRVSCEERGGSTIGWLHLALPLDVRQQRVCADTKYARLAAHLRGAPAGLADRQRGARAAAQPAGCRDDLAGVSLVRGHPDRLHPARRMGVWTPHGAVKKGRKSCALVSCGMNDEAFLTAASSRTVK